MFNAYYDDGSKYYKCMCKCCIYCCDWTGHTHSDDDKDKIVKDLSATAALTAFARNVVKLKPTSSIQKDRSVSRQGKDAKRLGRVLASGEPEAAFSSDPKNDNKEDGAASGPDYDNNEPLYNISQNILKQQQPNTQN